MKVLIACEESQEVCKAFRARGHEAYSCDIQEPSGGHPEWHILGDALKAVEGGQIVTMDDKGHYIDAWDLLIAHPPCTYLSNAGARHLWKGHQLQENRVMKGILGRDLFMRFWWADIPRICVENPVPSRVFCLPEYTQIIQPYQFGHPYSKKTCLWLKNLDPIVLTNVVEPIATWCPSGSYSHKHGEKHKGMFTTDRAKNRAKTFPGVAKAMSEQWGGEKMKYKPGAYIVSLDHLMGQELVYYGGKLLHKGWFGNWQLWYAKAELARLRIREAVRTEEEHETENEI